MIFLVKLVSIILAIFVFLHKFYLTLYMKRKNLRYEKKFKRLII